METNVTRFLQEIDELIRAGRASEAKSRLRHAQALRVPLEERRTFANLARRLNLPTLALRVLHPIVRPTGRHLARPATEAEKLEYAGSLVRLGAVDEALDLFKTLNAEVNPEVWLLTAFAHFSMWDYKSSIPLLQRYCAAPGLTDYQRLIGKANLAAALTYEKVPSALPLTEELLVATESGKMTLLAVNLGMMKAEAAIAEKDWEKARKALQHAQESVSDDTLEALFIRKWKAVTELYAQPKSSSAIEAIAEVRQQAVTRRHWETIRNCDFHLAVATKNEDLFLKVYFGTPFMSLKERLKNEFGSPPPLPERYEWRIKEGKGSVTLDLLSTQAIMPGVRGLKPGSSHQRLLGILLTDYYRPIRVASLHGLLYRGDFFNPVSSPGRVHQAVKRLKQWLSNRRLPIRVEARHGAYCLSATHPCTVTLPQGQRSVGRMDHHLSRLRSLTSATGFTAKEAAAALDLNVWTTIRLLSKGVEEGILERSGKANRTRYTFVEASALIAAA